MFAGSTLMIHEFEGNKSEKLRGCQPDSLAVLWRARVRRIVGHSYFPSIWRWVRFTDSK
jgi:hypothetical protein